MGFPSPAKDYEEDRLTIESLCRVDMNCRVIETSCGWAIINVALPVVPGVIVLAMFDGRNHFAKIAGKSLITEDGEAVEGEALEDVVVHGVVTYTINRTWDDGVAV